MCFNAGRNQPHDLFLKQLSVTAAILVPDHQIHHQSLQAPIGVGLHQLAHQFDIGRVANLQQYDWQIAGNCVTPEAGLGAAVFHEDARVAPQRGVGVDDAIGKAHIDLCVGLSGIDLPQHHLTMRPRQFKDAIREPSILVFLDQTQGCVTAFADPRNHIDGYRLLRIEGNLVADGDDRIQHGALTAGERPGVARGTHHSGSGDSAATANELHTISLK